MASMSSTAETVSAFRVLVLGPFALERDGVPIDTTKWQRRVASLCKLLATAPDQRRRRDEVIDTLWPDTAPDAGMGNLRIVAYRLRLALGATNPPPVVSEAGWIGLSQAHAWDVDLCRFEQLAQTAEGDVGLLEQALTLYRGEPLVEDRYDDWAVPIRAHVQHVWRDTSLQLAATLRRQGEFAQAAERLESVLDADSLDEEAVRHLLEVLYAAGRRADALRRYREFEQRLADEMGVPPSAETMETVRRLHGEFGGASVQEPLEMRGHPLPVGGFLGALPEGPMVARDEEIERILLAADLAKEAKGRLLLLRGERGAGKTRLAQETMVHLRDREFLVVSGRCFPRERAVQFYPFAEVMSHVEEMAPVSLRPHLLQQWPHVARLLGEVDQGMTKPVRVATEPVAAAERQHLFRVVTDLLTMMADERPLAVLLDDLHDADDASLDLLQHLVRHAGGHRIFFLGAYRDDDLGPDHPLNLLTRELSREGLLERVAVHRLTLEGTTTMVDLTVGPMDSLDEFAAFVYRRTRGNPFFVTAMLQALGGRYVLLRQIGRGGMGRVFEAVDTATGNPVAVKIMFARTEADPKALHRFEQEGAILAKLDHPNIVKVYRTFLDEYANCIVMELLEGRPLRDLAANQTLDLARIRCLAEQITAALVCAHGAGVVHRDIKPDNIMVAGADLVKVTDFGIAHLARPKGNLTTIASTGMTIGTPMYMAPEQIEGRRIDGRADIYSLGALLYELVAGRPPFQADDALAIALKHVHEAPVPPKTIVPDLRDDWNSLILTALAKDPADRFQSAGAMEQALKSLGVDSTVASGAGARLDDHVVVSAPDAQVVAVSIPDHAKERNSEKYVPAAVVEHPDASAPDSVPGGGGKRRSTRGWFAIAGVVPLLALVAVVVTAVRIRTEHRPSGALFATPAPVVVTHTPRARVPAVMDSESGRGPGQFEGPTGVSVDSRGNVYVVDQGNNRVQKISSDGRPAGSYGSEGTGPDQFKTPTDVSVGLDGKIYVADYGNSRIVVLAPGGRVLTILSHWPAQARGPETFSSVAVDRQGNVFGTDLFRDRIVELSGDNRWLAQWGRPGHGPGRFISPQGIAIDGSGLVYVADAGNNRIQKFSASHRPLTQWGQSGPPAQRLSTPQGLAVDAAGHVYVADTKHNRIQKFSASGALLASFGKFGTGPGQFNQPSAVAVDRQGNIYVTDYFNNRLQKFSPSGTPIWGSHGRSPGW
ncbi:MAG: hypothetical protein NVS4B2_06080 [Chloroflexota bacterium]